MIRPPVFLKDNSYLHRRHIQLHECSVFQKFASEDVEVAQVGHLAPIKAVVTPTTATVHVEAVGALNVNAIPIVPKLLAFSISSEATTRFSHQAAARALTVGAIDAAQVTRAFQTVVATAASAAKTVKQICATVAGTVRAQRSEREDPCGRNF